MEAQSVANTNFVLLKGDWTAQKAFRLVSELHAPYVIVKREEGPDTVYYYLFTLREVTDQLWSAPPDKPVKEALDLHESSMTPSVGALDALPMGPKRVVVTREGNPVGFVDQDFVPPPSFGIPPPPGTSPIRGMDDTSTSGSGAAPAPTRTLTAEFPDQVAVNDVAALQVYLTKSQVAAGMGIAITQAEGAEILVAVSARSGFTIQGRTDGTLTVGKEDDGEALSFVLRATTVGAGEIWIRAYYQGSSIGKPIRLTPSVVPGLPSTVTANPVTSQQTVTAVQPVSVPDLTMLIEELTQDGKPAFVVRLFSPDSSLGCNYKKLGPVVLQSDPGQYFRAFYSDIETMNISSQAEKDKTAYKLADKGAILFKSLFDEAGRRLLWSLKDQIKTAIVQSEEPWVPWELCRMFDEDGDQDDGPFFCEQFAITRWIPDGLPPRSALSLKDFAVVVPQNSNLPYANAELTYLQSLVQPGRTVTRVPAKFVDLQKALKSGMYDVWHFTGHGADRAPDPNKASMVLEDDVFTPENIAGCVKLRARQPLVFLNACQIGRGGMSLTDIGGWAKQFLDAGAGAFIGAYWSIYDQAACNFTSELYSRLMAGVPIGEAVKAARAEIRKLGDPTWLAYTVFADPLAKNG